MGWAICSGWGLRSSSSLSHGPRSLRVLCAEDSLRRSTRSLNLSACRAFWDKLSHLINRIETHHSLEKGKIQFPPSQRLLPKAHMNNTRNSKGLPTGAWQHKNEPVTTTTAKLAEVLVRKPWKAGCFGQRICWQVMVTVQSFRDPRRNQADTQTALCISDVHNPDRNSATQPRTYKLIPNLMRMRFAAQLQALPGWEWKIFLPCYLQTSPVHSPAEAQS